MQGRTEEDKAGIRKELERIKARRLTRSGQFFHGAERFSVRLFRMACGVALAVVAYRLFSSAWANVSDVPFAQLTLGKVFGLFGMGVLTLAMLAGAWYIAFGSPPSEAEELRKAEEQAEQEWKTQKGWFGIKSPVLRGLIYAALLSLLYGSIWFAALRN
jgi:hypothetical protein